MIEAYLGKAASEEVVGEYDPDESEEAQEEALAEVGAHEVEPMPVVVDAADAAASSAKSGSDTKD